MKELPSGAVLVSNPDQGLWSGSVAWQAVEDLRIGQPEGQGPDVFWTILDLEAAPNGDIYVLDRSQEVRHFSSTGQFLGSFGKAGEAPGEFKGATGIAVDDQGKIWVADGMLRRYTVFDQGGDLVRTQVMPPQAVGAFDHWPGVFDEEGGLYEISIGTPGLQGIPFTAIRIDPAGRVDTVPPLSYEFPLINGFPPPPDLMRRRIFALDSAGSVWVANTDQYRLVRQRRESWDTLRIIDAVATPITISKSEADSLARALAPAHVRREQIPSTRPVIQRLLPGPRGTLFVQLVTHPKARESLFDVFDSEGRFLGRVRTADRLAEGLLEPEPSIHGDRLYGIVTDSVGVQQVVRYKIAMPEAARGKAKL